MNETEFKNSVDERWDYLHNRKSRGRAFTGVILFIIGILLLLKTTEVIVFPRWFFTWPMIFIAIGLVSGFRDNFRAGGWMIFLLLGGLFLANDIEPAWQTQRYIWPIVLIAIGLGFILRPRRKTWHKYGRRGFEERSEELRTDNANHRSASAGYDRRDFIDITAVLGGVKKIVLTKTFKGGDITSFMGGSEIDLTQADFTGTIRIDVTNVFGGTKLIVPPTWDVQSEITAVLGGVDDKRQLSGVKFDPEKVLILDGTCVFGGIDIRSY